MKIYMSLLAFAALVIGTQDSFAFSKGKAEFEVTVHRSAYFQMEGSGNNGVRRDSDNSLTVSANYLDMAGDGKTNFIYQHRLTNAQLANFETAVIENAGERLQAMIDKACEGNSGKRYWISNDYVDVWTKGQFASINGISFTQVLTNGYVRVPRANGTEGRCP